MSIQTARNEKLIAQERISTQDFVSIITQEYAALLVAYHLPTKTLQFNPEQIAVALGYDIAELNIRDTPFSDFVHPEDMNHVVEMLHQFDTHADASFNERIRMLHKDGSYVTYRLQIRQNTGSSYVMLIAVHDLSVGMEMDEISELKRTKAAVIEDLQRSNKELEEFAYVASHDLQEPLRKISTFSGRLTEKFGQELNDEGRLYLERINASADNMRILIENLLEFSRITRIKQHFSPISFNFVLQQVINELELKIEETQTTIIADELPTLEASLPQMKQLFNNIINNAIKFRKPEVAPEIKVLTHRLSPDEASRYGLSSERTYHRIQICDNGIGFEPEYAGRIFQIFQRLHGKSEYPGSGIGLAICKKIVDHHHGIIFAENVEELGACFTIILPEKQN
ncbi:MAG TPA: ATP-binding protein [Flavipsychrobacter sp.]|nr:ATP-binding protein [Flavipsychrobacter sp.]